MLDAQSNRPLINDKYAEKLLGNDGLAYWEDFKNFTFPNSTNIARCYLIDTHLGEIISRNSETTVILIGAGLDSRAFRLPHGNWIEVDEPGVIDYKNEVLPVSQCPNPLKRISIDFENEELGEKLKPFSNSNPVIVVEGVLMYLTQAQRATLFDTLAKTIGSHTLLCDLMTEHFFDKIAKGSEMYAALNKSGAHFIDMTASVSKLLQDRGYKTLEVISNLLTASKFGLVPIPRLFLKLFFPRLSMGYSVYRFEYQG
jgi:methyltransferase (TIGR00027 family)